MCHGLQSPIFYLQSNSCTDSIFIDHSYCLVIFRPSSPPLEPLDSSRSILASPCSRINIIVLLELSYGSKATYSPDIPLTWPQMCKKFYIAQEPSTSIRKRSRVQYGNTKGYWWCGIMSTVHRGNSHRKCSSAW